MPDIRRDKTEFPSREAAEAVADKIEGARVIAGDRYGQVFYVEDAAGKRIHNPEPPLKVNPLRGIPDRFEPAPKPQGRGIDMTEPDVNGNTHYTGTRRHG